MSQRFYRINVSSTSLVSGTTLDGLYPVSLYNNLDDMDYQVAVESFVVSSTAPSGPFLVELPLVVGRDSFGTVNGGASSAIACFRGATNIVAVTANSYGARLNSTTAFTGQQLRVRLSNPDGTLASVFAGNPVFYMCLIMYPVLKK